MWRENPQMAVNAGRKIQELMSPIANEAPYNLTADAATSAAIKILPTRLPPAS